MRLKPFLRRFSAGYIYAKLLTRYCCDFKNKKTTQEIINVAQLLLDQNLFMRSKKGKLYEVLCQALEKSKDSYQSGEIIIKALNDPVVSEIQKLSLKLRGQNLLKKKTNSIDDKNLKQKLDVVCSLAIQESPSIEITGRALQGNKSGSKAVYIEETKHCKIFTSVEERALLHYKSQGYSKGN